MRMNMVEFFVGCINVCGDEVEVSSGDRYEMLNDGEVERVLKMCEMMLGSEWYVEEDSWGVLGISMSGGYEDLRG